MKSLWKHFYLNYSEVISPKLDPTLGQVNNSKQTSYVIPSDVFLEKCDNLLVGADIFTILGVSFCVMQNTFNLINIKKQDRSFTV